MSSRSNCKKKNASNKRNQGGGQSTRPQSVTETGDGTKQDEAAAGVVKDEVTPEKSKQELAVKMKQDLAKKLRQLELQHQHCALDLQMAKVDSKLATQFCSKKSSPTACAAPRFEPETPSLDLVSARILPRRLSLPAAASPP